MTETWKWLIVIGMLATPRDTNGGNVTIGQVQELGKDLKEMKVEAKQLNRTVDSNLIYKKDSL